MEYISKLTSILLLEAITMTNLLVAFSTLAASCTPGSAKSWALLVTNTQAGEDFLEADGDYMYHTIFEHYDFDGIYYLHDNASLQGVNATSTKNNVRWAITNWLQNVSDGDDLIFIYFNMHGGGYHQNAHQNMGGRYDEDEELDHYDECLVFYNQTGQNDSYWDDELRDDLNTLNGTYSKLVLATQSCFGGGLITDLGTADRIILTSTGEDRTAYADLDVFRSVTDCYSEWSEVLIDALHYQDTYWSSSQGVVHQNITVDADYNNDNHVTMLEAWDYANEHDDATNQTLINQLIGQAILPLGMSQKNLS